MFLVIAGGVPLCPRPHSLYKAVAIFRPVLVAKAAVQIMEILLEE